MVEAKGYFAAKAESVMLANFAACEQLVDSIKKSVKGAVKKGKAKRILKAKAKLARAKSKLNAISVQCFGPDSDGSAHDSDTDSASSTSMSSGND